MVFRRRVLFQTKLAVAIQLIDSYTGVAPIGKQIKVWIENIPQKPVQKADGMYIFRDLPTGSYKVFVEADHYMSACTEVEVKDRLEGQDHYPFVSVFLIPSSSYPVPQGATILRTAFLDTSGLPVSGVKVQAIPCSTDSFRAKIAQANVSKGSQVLSLTQITGRISKGDQFILINPQEEGSEFCQISEILNLKTVKLESPLQHEYVRGATIVPVVQGSSDHKGELILLFRFCKARSYNVKLEISYLQYKLVKEVRIAVGNVHQLGTIQIPK